MPSIATLAIFGSHAEAQSNNFATGYPKEGANKGTIVAAGTAKAQAGFTLLDKGFVLYWPAAGGLSKGIDIDVNVVNGQWHWDKGKNAWTEAVITGLTSGAEYWVICTVYETGGGFPAVTNPITTTAVKVKAK